MQATQKKTVAIGLAGSRLIMKGAEGWSSPLFTAGYIRGVNSLVEKLRAKADAVSIFLNERMDPATKECVDSYQLPSGDSNRLRLVLAEYLNAVISGDCIYEPARFQNVRIRPETEILLKQSPQGKALIQLNRSVLEDAYYKELYKSWAWQPNAEFCHPSHGLEIDRFEIIHESNFAHVAAEISEQVSFISPSTIVKPHVVELTDPWDFEEVYLALDGWADNYPFDVDKERYLVHMIKGTFVQQMCLFMLVESKQIPAILARHKPPDENHPHGTVQLVDLDRSRYDKIAARFESRQKDAVSSLKRGIETRNASYNRLIEEIERVAVRTTKPILLLGPTGAGKSELAHRIYKLRHERKLVTGDLVSLNCSTIRGDGAMSALFGHVKGAFTGATENRVGAVLAANKGVLFLDEIGALAIEQQAQLLNALDTKKFRPNGGDIEKSSDFQLISATNMDLHKAVQTGAFRQDLLARIQLWSFELPGLKDRPEDIEPNLDYELERWRREEGKRVRISREVRVEFLRFAVSPGAKWTTNFRDLIGIVERMATLAEGGIITPAVLKTEIDRLKQRWAREEEPSEGSDAILRSLMGEDRFAKLDLIERIQLSAVIPVCREFRSAAKAAKKLFAVSLAEETGGKKKNPSARMTSYLKQFGLTFDDCAGRS